MSHPSEKQIVSLGGGCDVALKLLQPHGRASTTHFFDYLWNLDGGLTVVQSIIESDFHGFDALDEFVFARHPEWNTERAGTGITLGCGNLQAEQLVHRRYPNVAFIHYRRNEELVDTLHRKAERFRVLLAGAKPIQFVYYRGYNHSIDGRYYNGTDYDINEKLSYFERETTEFHSFLQRVRPQLPFHLWAIFLSPPERMAGVSDAIDEFIEATTPHPAISFAQATHAGRRAPETWTAILERIDRACAEGLQVERSRRWNEPTIQFSRRRCQE